MITITVAEAWMILHKVRQSNSDGKPWGEWGQHLWLKMLDVILQDKDTVVDFTEQECWGILSQVLFTDAVGAGTGMKMVGMDINKKIGRLLLNYSSVSILQDFTKGGEDDGTDKSYREAVSDTGADVPA